MEPKVDEAGDGQSARRERIVYVMPEESSVKYAEDDLDFQKFLFRVWRSRIAIVLIVVAFATASTIYAMVATKWYRAEVLLAPAEAKSAPSLGGQLGGLVALAGGRLGAADTAEAVAVLESRELAGEFVNDLQLTKVFFADQWDEGRQTWSNDDATYWPDSRDAVDYFHGRILRVTTVRQSSLVTISVDWTDPEVASIWAAELVHRVNSRMRNRALHEAESNVEYLKQELAASNVVTFQQSIGRLLESEMQKFMLARGSEEFAFRVIDAAKAPKYPIRPKRVLIVLVGTILGTIFAVFVVLLGQVVRETRKKATNFSP
jgi:uncharacterized protein involved in exopolysaccharide biosynthesis